MSKTIKINTDSSNSVSLYRKGAKADGTPWELFIIPNDDWIEGKPSDSIVVFANNCPTEYQEGYKIKLSNITGITSKYEPFERGTVKTYTRKITVNANVEIYEEHDSFSELLSEGGNPFDTPAKEDTRTEKQKEQDDLLNIFG